MKVLYYAEGYKYKKEELHNLLGSDFIGELLKKRVLVKLTDSALSPEILEEDEIQETQADREIAEYREQMLKEKGDRDE